MQKIAILVTAAEAPQIFGRMLEMFDDSRFHFFLHLDARGDLGSYASALGHIDRVKLVEPRGAVFAGGFSAVEAELVLLRAALADPSVQALVSWSDNAAPLRGPDAIYQALQEAPDRIDCEVLPDVQAWYGKFYLGDSFFSGFQADPTPRSFGAADWKDVQRLRRFTKRGKRPLKTVYRSRHGWALSRQSAIAMLRRMAKDEHLVESFRYSLLPTETFFATLFRLCFPAAETLGGPGHAMPTRLLPGPGYATVEQLPDLTELPTETLFIPDIAPAAVAVADRVIAEWARPPEHAAAAADAAAQQEYERALTAAIETRDDGEVEESVMLFEAVFDLRPGDPRTSLELAHTLKKLRRFADADRVLGTAMELYPEDGNLRHVWADLPGQTLDHDEIIRRAEVYRGLFPPSEFPGAWHSLGVQFGSFTESLRWNDMRESIIALHDQAIRHPSPLRICLWQATELCLTDQQRALLDAGEPDAWAQLPPEAKINIRCRIELAELNRKLLAAVNARVISIGQNCLPYLLSGRWGLIAERERPEAMTPFDRGAFQKEKAAVVIDTDFSTFSDRAAFSETKSWEGARMYQHDDTGVYFYHERGTTWFQNDGAMFFTHVDRMVGNWRRVSVAGRRLFVFCLCGEGDLARLIEVMERRLLGPDAQLLIVDVLQQPHDCPVHEHVTYLHLPYPSHYAWDNFTHQSAARGIGFELGVVLPVMDHMMSLLPEQEAAAFALQRHRLLRRAAGASAAWRHDHENTVVLHAALHEVSPGSVDDTMAYARALCANGRMEDAQEVLAHAKALDPTNYEVHATWADAGVAPFDWAERLARLRALRAAFPPEVEPRSWATLAEELSTLHAHGLWNEAVALIETQWPDFSGRADLLPGALEVLIQLGHLALARRLLEEAAVPARATLPETMVKCILRRLDQADANRALLHRAGARVIPLGQNGMPGMLMARAGLFEGPRMFDESTPFELGDFYRDTTAEAIADDFAALSSRTAYAEKPAWGGGVTPRHDPSGVTFMLHRAAKIGPMEEQRFFAHLDRMIARWRQIKHEGRRIFVFFYYEMADLPRLVAEVKDKLLGQDGKLVVVDLHEQPTPVPNDAQVTFLHAPPPKHFSWVNGLGSASPEGIAYEARVLAPVVEFLKGDVVDRVRQAVSLPETTAAD